MSAPRTPDHPIDPLFTDRWSPRAFAGTEIAEPELLSLLEAARWSPSAYNAQPWRFVYARRGTAAWAPIFGTLVEFNQGWARSAAALVVVASAEQAVFPGADAPAPNASHAFDAGAAWAGIAFQATLSGWSAHAMAGFDADALKAAVGLPDGHAIHAVVAIGKRGDKSVLPDYLQAMEQPSGRKPLGELAFEGRFDAA